MCAAMSTGFMGAQASGGAPSTGGGQTGAPMPVLNGNSSNEQKSLLPTNQIPSTQMGPDGTVRYVQGLQAQSQPGTLPPLEPTEFQRIVTTSSGRSLPIFGEDLFNVVPSTFSPVDNIPVTPDYVIGPGDELQLQVWGQVNQSNSYTVDRTGTIYLSSVGPVHVAGVQFSQLREFLRSQLSRVYRNFDLNVNLGQLRSIQVFVVGQARKPGSYTIGSLSTLLNALFASGGPLPQGSLRDVQVRRGTKIVTHFDLYDLLLHGDKSKDVALESGDVIFIPHTGPQVAVLGSVITPAIYELRAETSFNQVIALAGGRSSGAAGSFIRVERIAEHKERSVVNLDLEGANLKDMPAQDGDIVTVSPIIDRYKNAVTLRGNVANPGRYVWTPGMRILDLIPGREALITRNYYEKTNQLGQNNLDYRGSRSEGALGIASGGRSQGTTGSKMDNTSTQTQQQNNVPGSNNGSSTQSNTKNPNNTGNSVGEALTEHNALFPAKTDVVLQAPDIDWDYAVIERQNSNDLTTSLIPFNLGKVIVDKDSSQNMELLQGDIVTIFSKADVRVPSAQQTRFVRLEGEFNGAGVYSVLPGETLRQLLTRAGGLTPDAYLYASEFTRESTRRVQKQRLQEYADSLEAQIASQTSSSVSGALTDRDAAAARSNEDIAKSIVTRLRQAEPTGRIVLELKPDSRGIAAMPDLVLEDGDRLVIPKVPSSVNVEGQVYSASAFVWQPDRQVKTYLHMAGGPDRNADKRREYVLRADGSVFSRQYGDFDHALVYPGDTIVVPPVIQRGNTLRELANISTILSGFGLAAAAITILK